MNLRQTIGKERRTEDIEIDVTPVMNIFVILIPFLLLTASFIKIASIDFSLPSTDQTSSTAANAADLKDLTVLVVSIQEKGFEVKTSEKKLPFVNMVDGKYDLKLLGERLKSVKKDFPKLEDVIISPAASIRYDTIVKVMDKCRESGFPNFSISG
ncbi:biopolymer transport protein ExbD/TolR [bacterium BMS3Abin05]|nr:biopolymer transport protein ExbD/TolR [bacterium BMS3Abin05]GBE27183.1 biopolymer transport protein ExbD/TolR [bacterium BMS3Bbin03]HDK36009.1 biopolymer transporter ExbD [Bacteroidota bacterium]HDL78090.1 biopolymer transporter ExbD [Bacteroidota bacterium]HDZ11457.1 biopolymer transporter ExbD [Bacteroidota bacterium]